MDSITMSSNQVILGVKAGRGFGFLNKSFIIEANLNGHTIKTDLLQPSHNITIGAELLWQAEKKVLKRLRIGNVPLKVECFPVANGKKEERVGFILMTLRAAKTIAPNSMLSDTPGTWHSLLGLKTNIKSYNPSLLLNLHVEETGMADWKESTASASPVSKFEIPLMSFPKSITYNEHHQQLTSTFLMTLSLESAGDLHLLAESPNQSDGIFALSWDIMGCTKQERKICELSSLILDTDCKFTVRVPGYLESLIDYLQRKDLAVITLTSNGNEIAYCHVNGSYLISEDVLRTFHYEQSFNDMLFTRSRFYFTKISTNDIPVSESGSSPFIDTALTIQYLYDDNRVVGQGESESCNEDLSVYETRSFSTDINGSLRNHKDMHIFDVDNGIQPQQYSEHEWFAMNFTLDSIQVHTTSLGNRFYIRCYLPRQILKEDCKMFMVTPGGNRTPDFPQKNYARGLFLLYLQDAGFEQASAMAVLRHREPVVVKGVGRFEAARGVAATLLLGGSIEEVRREVALRRPAVLLLAAAADRGGVPLATGQVDAAPLFRGKINCLSVVELKNLEGVVCARVKVRLALEEVIVTSRMERPRTPPAESYINESLQSHSSGLPTNVSEDQENCETDLCAKELAPTPSTLEVEYQLKLQECREASRRMEDDFKLEVSRLQTENKHLLDQIALQEDENDHLLKMKQDLEKELEKLKRNSLTEDQIAGILKDLKLAEEKYEIAYRSKIFFKEQWARAMREIHNIKSKYRDEINMQIKYNREELRYFGRMLPPCEEPRRRPASCPSPPPPPPPPPPSSPPPSSPPPPPPSPGPDGDAPEDTSPPLSCYSPKKGTGNDLQKSSVEFKLQELVQQRDCLLNTGTYFLDHHLISMLNKQIRQLLAESTHKFE